MADKDKKASGGTIADTGSAHKPRPDEFGAKKEISIGGDILPPSHRGAEPGLKKVNGGDLSRADRKRMDALAVCADESVTDRDDRRKCEADVWNTPFAQKDKKEKHAKEKPTASRASAPSPDKHAPMAEVRRPSTAKMPWELTSK